MTTAHDALLSIPLPRPGVDGLWHGHFALGSRDPSATFEATEELLSYLVRLSATGALASDAAHMGGSRLDIDVVCSGPSLHARLSARHMHPGSWRLLLQLLAHCHGMEPFDTVEWVDDTGIAGPVGGSLALAAMRQDYPPIFDEGSGLASHLNSHDLDDSLSVAIACEREVSSDELARLSSLVEDWGSLVYVGAFTPVSELIDAPLLDKPDLVRQGWSAFDITIRHWSPNAAALVILLNLLITLRTDLSIASIEIQ